MEIKIISKKRNRYNDTDSDTEDELPRKRKKSKIGILLKDKFPKIFEQIHPTKNDKIDIDRLTCSADIEIWWVCDKAKCEHHIWSALVSTRTRARGNGCGFCSGIYTCECDSFGHSFPKLLQEFVNAGNDREIAFKISIKSIDIPLFRVTVT